MRVLLRNADSGLFYAGSAEWTSDPADALDFEETDRALDAVCNDKLSGVQILMRFDDPVYEIPLTVAGFGG